jgi:hypothetical protein
MSHTQTRYSAPFAFAVLSLAVLMIVVPILGAVHRNRPPSQDKESPMPQRPALLIDDFSNPDRMSALGTFWRGFTDQVMGGVSTATSRMETIEGRRALRLVGDVSLENNGGFVQVALPLTGSGAPLDVSTYRGIRLTVRGNGETYHIHLRTTGTALPDDRPPVRRVQSRRAGIQARSHPVDPHRRGRLRKSFPGRCGRRQDRVLPVITGNETSLRASIAMHPLQRIGEPADVVSAIAWLADPRNGWITGQILGVDGGLGSVRSRH